jgi:GTP cyclohydrolase II
VTERVPTGVHLSAANARYLAVKRDHTQHTLDLHAPGLHALDLPLAG